MILAIIQARMKSKRLPGKVLKPILGKPLIGYLLERVGASSMISKIILATSTDKSNDPLAEYVDSLGVEVFRGEEKDVLERYYQAAYRYFPQGIVRITGDCPLVDPRVIDEVVKFYLDRNFDYVSNTHPPTYPDGMDVEVFSLKILKEARTKAKAGSEREHVTPYMFKQEHVEKANIAYKEDLSPERWTVDTPEDFILIKKIIEGIYPRKHLFSMQDVLELKNRKPAMFRGNRNSKRNEGYRRSLRADRAVKRKKTGKKK